jgi:hypothetical protein
MWPISGMIMGLGEHSHKNDGNIMNHGQERRRRDN